MLKVDRPKKNSFRPNFYHPRMNQQLLEVCRMTPCTCASSLRPTMPAPQRGRLKWSSIDFERKSITINHKVTEQLVNGKYVPVVSDVMKTTNQLPYSAAIPAVEEELLKQKESSSFTASCSRRVTALRYLVSSAPIRKAS